MHDWKDWCSCWNSNILATWCEELTHWKRPQCWERLKAGGKGDNRVWDGWMASLTQWTWVWAGFRSWWRTGKPGMLQSMRSQRVRHNWATELTEMGKSGNSDKFIFLSSKITADSDCSHKIKRCLLLGRKAITNPDSILKSRDITLQTEVHRVKAIVFPVGTYRCEI